MDTVVTTRRRFPGCEEQLPCLRAFVRHVLAAHPGQETIALLAGELATNAVRHTKSGSPDGSFLVTLCFDGNRARVEVHDEGGPALPRVLPPSVDEEFGRGLLLVQELADFWGFETSETGTSVWLCCSSDEEGGGSVS